MTLRGTLLWCAMYHQTRAAWAYAQVDCWRQWHAMARWSERHWYTRMLRPYPASYALEQWQLAGDIGRMHADMARACFDAAPAKLGLMP